MSTIKLTEMESVGVFAVRYWFSHGTSATGPMFFSQEKAQEKAFKMQSAHQSALNILNIIRVDVVPLIVHGRPDGDLQNKLDDVESRLTEAEEANYDMGQALNKIQSSLDDMIYDLDEAEDLLGGSKFFSDIKEHYQEMKEAMPDEW